MKIKQLYKNQKQFWKEENEKYFGITPLDNWNISKEDIVSHLQNCVDSFYNNGTCEFKELLKSEKCKDYDKCTRFYMEMIPSSIVLSGDFLLETGETKRVTIAYLPIPTDLCWLLNESEYVLRINATPIWTIIKRKENICNLYNKVIFDLDERTVSKGRFFRSPVPDKDRDSYELTVESAIKDFLNGDYKISLDLVATFNNVSTDEINADNIFDALQCIPEHENNSILFFNFTYIDGIFNMVKASKRFISPLSAKPTAINTIKLITSRGNDGASITSKVNDDSDSSGILILSQSRLFALENARTILYNVKNNGGFFFKDTINLLDAFKTSTNQSAGRSRLVLDDVYPKDGKLIITDENDINKNIVDFWKLQTLSEEELTEINKRQDLSCLSISPFSSNDEAKRIMMTAKLRPQAVPVIDEEDSLTHEIDARVVFGDYKGFSFGDSIIISESFAKRLTSFVQDERIPFTNKMFKEEFMETYKIGDYISTDFLAKYVDSKRFRNYRYVICKNITSDGFTIDALIPFSVGDKLTNLHGSKGIVSLILPDDEMPYLENDLGPNMKAGPFEVIFSALSVFKRKSLGQIFEAWAKAVDCTDANDAKTAIEKHGESIAEYGKNSVVRWNGNTTVKPCGINSILRLNHDAVTKQSFSEISENPGYMLKFGEMENLNLAARGLYGIMNELDVRSIIKNSQSYDIIKAWQENARKEIENASKESFGSNNFKFFDILNNMGFEFLFDGKTLQENYLKDVKFNGEFCESNAFLKRDKIDLWKEIGE